MQKKFEQISHTADLQIRVYGDSLSELFIHALEGMFQVIKPRSDLCVEKNNQLVCRSLPCIHDIRIAAPDKEVLLVDYLSESLYLSDIYNEAYCKVIIHNINDTSLFATLYGVPVKGFAIEIKAVTYHGLSIQRSNELWQVDIIFDI